MNQCRPCGCKGVRTCLVCEKEFNLQPLSYTFPKKEMYTYCHKCRMAWSDDSFSAEDCPKHNGKNLVINGIFILPNFLTEEEKTKLLIEINNQKWDLSQSGRRKQNYGPKCNFKKKKIQIGNFIGFPRYSKLVHDKLKSLPILKDFSIIEQCSLEYDPKRGASIDPHIDDCWIWGERIVTVNILGNTYLSMIRFKGEKTKYNLDEANNYSCVLDENEHFSKDFNKPFQFDAEDSENENDIGLRIYMPEKSLIILYGSARYEWEHYISREDIKSLRICLAYREFTPPYLPGGEKEDIGKPILEASNKFW